MVSFLAELNEIVRIPIARIAVLVGTNGSVKKRIEDLTRAKISIDSKNGEVEVRVGEKFAINFYNALNIIKAIGRGFSPEHAFLLSDEDFLLDVIKLEDIVGKSSKAIEQKKGRIIGKNGASRKAIEEKTDCFVSVYGGTISLIGTVENLEIARKAVEMLLDGSTHEYVYKFLNKRKSLEFEL